MSITSTSNPDINGEYYYIRNAQGDITGLFDKGGNIVVTYIYDSWGQTISVDGSLKDTVGKLNPYRYRGYRYDSETGLYYLQSRYYNPVWGRFINADGIVGVHGDLLTANMFAYCMSNPVNMTDPSGQFGFLLPLVIGVAEVVVSIVTAVIVAAPVIINEVSMIVSVYGSQLAGVAQNLADKKTASTTKDKTKPASSGKAKNKLKPDPSAQSDHTTFKRNPDSGEITNYETWKTNPKNPTGFDSQKRYDGTGSPHTNPVTGEDLMPHVHDKTVPGKVREPIPWEVPRKP